jgi:ABC-type multidrug transport system ATPase subunit
MQIWLRKKARAGKTVVVATHLLAEWEAQADRCLVFADGQIADELDPATLSGSNRLNRADPESG